MRRRHESAAGCPIFRADRSRAARTATKVPAPIRLRQIAWRPGNPGNSVAVRPLAMSSRPHRKGDGRRRRDPDAAPPPRPFQVVVGATARRRAPGDASRPSKRRPLSPPGCANSAWPRPWRGNRERPTAIGQIPPGARPRTRCGPMTAEAVSARRGTTRRAPPYARRLIGMLESGRHPGHVRRRIRRRARLVHRAQLAERAAFRASPGGRSRELRSWILARGRRARAASTPRTARATSARAWMPCNSSGARLVVAVALPELRG